MRGVGRTEGDDELRAKELARIYKILDRLRRERQELTGLAAIDAVKVPASGVYFFLDPEQVRGAGFKRGPRLVYVGINTKRPLLARLKSHYRRSSLRTRVLSKVVRQEMRGRTRTAHPEHQAKVDRHQDRLELLWVNVPSLKERVLIERGILGILTAGRPLEPSRGWIGRRQPAHRGAKFGIWNQQHVGRKVPVEQRHRAIELLGQRS